MRATLPEGNPTSLYKVAAEMQLPDWFLRGEELPQSALDQLPDNSFADRDLRRYPIHTKVACLASTIAYFGEGESSGLLGVRLKQASQVHGISDAFEQVRNIFERASTPIKEAAAAPQPLYALAINEGEGNTRYFYPIGNETELTRSARNLTKAAQEMRLPPSFVRDAAERMVKRAAELGLDPARTLVPEVVTMGTTRIPDFDTALAGVLKRAEVYNLPDYASDLYRETIEAAKAAYFANEPIDPFLEVIETLDAGAGIKYSALIKDPYRLLYSGPPTEEVEKFARAVVFVGNVAVPSETFARLQDQDIDGMFSESHAQSLKQARAVAISDSPAASHAIAGIGNANEAALLRLLLQAAA